MEDYNIFRFLNKQWNLGFVFEYYFHLFIDKKAMKLGIHWKYNILKYLKFPFHSLIFVLKFLMSADLSKKTVPAQHFY